MLKRSHRAARGMSVIEFVVASALILTILVASGTTVANMEQALAENRARDGATVIVANVLNQAQQFRCQLEVDPASASGESARCLTRLTGAVQGTSVAGDIMFTSTSPAGCRSGSDPGCVSYTALVTSRWLHAGEDPSACQSTGRQPALLRRTLEVRWRTTGSAEEVVSRTSAYQAPPSSTTYDPSSSRVLVVRAEAGTVVSLATSTGTLLRVAEACTGGGKDGEAWFPYLPTGSFTVNSGAKVADQWASGVLEAPGNGGGKTFDGNSPACAIWEPGTEVRPCSQ
jgi:hypothetical protein